MPERLRCRGRSMAEALSDGDVLFVEPLDGPPGVGDLVVFTDSTGTRTVVHRVHAVAEDDSLVTKGDANDVPDGEHVPLRRVRGRVVDALRVRRHRPRPWWHRAGARLAGPLYRGVARRAWLRRALRAALRPRLTRLQTQTGQGSPLVLVVHRGRTVAWLYPETGRMRSSVPYALLVDPPSGPERDDDPGPAR